MWKKQIPTQRENPTSNVTQDFKEQILDDVKDRREAVVVGGVFSPEGKWKTKP